MDRTFPFATAGYGVETYQASKPKPTSPQHSTPANGGEFVANSFFRHLAAIAPDQVRA